MADWLDITAVWSHVPCFSVIISRGEYLTMLSSFVITAVFNILQYDLCITCVRELSTTGKNKYQGSSHRIQTMAKIDIKEYQGMYTLGH